MRVSQAFAAAGITPAPTEGAFRLTCDECGAGQRLPAMHVSEIGDVTIYACRSCGRSLVGVKSFEDDAEAREASGYRLKSNVVGSKVDVLIDDFGPGPRPVLLAATPAFFD
ncbi:MAG TPA: hypothetical protein VFY47_03650 [Thermoleophilaceae bacterium]|nr:hypothetical protein [Thermoleophilaceae bacterium]